MDTEGGGEADTSQSQSMHKKGHMTNSYLKESDGEAIVDFVKDHEELYDETNEHRARKECLWESLASSHKLSVKVAKTWFESQRTHYGKLSKSGQAPKEMTERQNWIKDKLNFLKTHQAQGASASAASAHDISRDSNNKNSMEISMQFNTTILPLVTTPPSAVSQCSTVGQQLVGQFCR